MSESGRRRDVSKESFLLSSSVRVVLAAAGNVALVPAPVCSEVGLGVGWVLVGFGLAIGCWLLVGWWLAVS